MNPLQTAPSGTSRATMQVATAFDTVGMLRTHRVTGPISLPAFRGMLQDLYAAKQFSPDMHALWDVRQADFSGIMPEDVRELMHVVVTNWGRSGACRSAIVVSSMAEFGVVRIYISQFGQKAPCQLKVFLDLTEARQWLGLDPKQDD